MGIINASFNQNVKLKRITLQAITKDKNKKWIDLKTSVHAHKRIALLITQI